MKKTLPLVVTLGSLLLAGCASIISGTSQSVTIDSNVAGATVNIEGSSVGVTPFTGKIPRKRESVAVVSKPGYGTQSVTLTTSFNSVALLSIFWDYSTTDCLTGACWEYAPNNYYVNLRPATSSDSNFKKDTELKAFTMTYFTTLHSEIAAGSGAKLDAIHKAYFASMSKADFINEVKSVDAKANGNAVAFGEILASKVSLN